MQRIFIIILIGVVLIMMLFMYCALVLAGKADRRSTFSKIERSLAKNKK